MSDHLFHKEQNIAVEAVREAALLCRAVQAQISPEVLKKRDRSPVTVADFGSQALVCHTLKTAFPDDPIIAEENATELRQPENKAVLEQVVAHVRASRPEADRETVCSWIDYGTENDHSERYWTLDPIDGTKGFLRGEQYAVALALIVEGEIQVAALACPNLPDDIDSPASIGRIFTAVRGHGTTQQSCVGDTDPVPVFVSIQKESARARFCESVEASHSSHSHAAEVAATMGIMSPSVRLDSQAKYAIVARGDAEFYMRLPTRGRYIEKIWDHAAGTLIITEAGGTVTDVHGKPLEFKFGKRLEKNRGVVATNGLLHEDVISAIRAAGVK